MLDIPLANETLVKEVYQALVFKSIINQVTVHLYNLHMIILPSKLKAQFALIKRVISNPPIPHQVIIPSFF
jgi:hypothetical protein